MHLLACCVLPVPSSWPWSYPYWRYFHEGSTRGLSLPRRPLHEHQHQLQLQQLPDVAIIAILLHSQVGVLVGSMSIILRGQVSDGDGRVPSPAPSPFLVQTLFPCLVATVDNHDRVFQTSARQQRHLPATAKAHGGQILHQRFRPTTVTAVQTRIAL